MQTLPLLRLSGGAQGSMVVCRVSMRKKDNACKSLIYQGRKRRIEILGCIPDVAAVAMESDEKDPEPEMLQRPEAASPDEDPPGVPPGLMGSDYFDDDAGQVQASYGTEGMEWGH